MCTIMALGFARVAMSQAANEGAWRLSGSYLNLFTRSRTVVPPSTGCGLGLNRLRLKLEARPLRSVGLEVQYDNEVLLGSYLKTAQYALTASRVETSFDLQHEYASRSELVARHGLYRAMLTWSGNGTDVKVGRQRIALGTGYFWSPMDLLNPIDPTRLERDYRAGADAVLAEHRLGALGRVAGIYVPSTSRMKSVAAGYVHGNVRGTDYSAVIGTFRGDDIVGADFSSSIGGLGLRGEATATREEESRHFGRALIGVDYGLPNSLSVTAEAYYNGRGASEPSRYDVAALLAGRALNLARWYGAIVATFQATPLVKLASYAVFNASDGSAVLWPRLEWSAKADIDLAIGIQRFSGGARSEYGRLSNLLHVEARWFF